MTQQELNNALIEKSKILKLLIDDLLVMIQSNTKDITALKVMYDAIIAVNDSQAKINDNFNTRLEAIEKQLHIS